MKNRKIIADLHNHSTASDGEYTPAELVMKGRDIGLKAIGLTDHDSIAGLDEALEAGHLAGISVVPGIEVTLRFKREIFVGSLHLLLYFPEVYLKDSEFREKLMSIVGKGRGINLVKDRVNAINREFGPEGKDPLLTRPLTVDEIQSHGINISRRHFALALSEDHNIKEKETIDILIGNKSPAYIPSGIDPLLLRPFFEQYPVVKVLSHPAAGSFPGTSHYKEVLPPIETVEQLLPEFIDKNIVGIDGIEVYYPAHTQELEEVLLAWSEKYGLLVTGGSDCHDSTVRPLGVAGMTHDELDKLILKVY